MRLIFLAQDVAILPFLRAAQELPGMEVIAGWTDLPEFSELLRTQIPGLHLVESWDQLLPLSYEAVLLAGTSDMLLSAANQLVQSQRPLFIVTGLQGGPESLFRVMRLRQEDQSLLRPLFCAGVQPYLAENPDRALSGPENAFPPRQVAQAFSSPLRKIDFVRRLESHIDLTPREIDRWLLQDLSWLTPRAGDPQQVTMRTSTAPSGRVIEAELILTGEGAPEVRWTLQALTNSPGWRLGLHTAEQEVTIEVDRHMAHAMRINSIEHRVPFLDASLEEAARRLKNLQSEFDGANESRVSQTAEIREWQNVVGLGEICAVARRSLAKRRTLDLQHDDSSELSQFKSQMTAVGCGALLWAMLGTVGLLTMMTILDPRDREYRISKSAGFVMTASEFHPQPDPEGQLLTVLGREHLGRVAEKWTATAPVLILESAGEGQESIDESRKQAVVSILNTQGKREPERRIVIRSIPGRWFERAALLGWSIVLGPLVLVLVLQGFIVAARGPENSGRGQDAR